jgi:hypothetical protein
LRAEDMTDCEFAVVIASSLPLEMCRCADPEDADYRPECA